MAIPLDLRLDHSGGDCRQYSGAGFDQIAGPTLPVDAANGRGIVSHFLVVPFVLAFRFETLFQRKFLSENGFTRG